MISFDERKDSESTVILRTVLQHFSTLKNPDYILIGKLRDRKPGQRSHLDYRPDNPGFKSRHGKIFSSKQAQTAFSPHVAS